MPAVPFAMRAMRVFLLRSGARSPVASSIARLGQLSAPLRQRITRARNRAKLRHGVVTTAGVFYSARSREAYARACSALFGEPESVIKADLTSVLEHVEAWQPEGSSSGEGPETSPEDEARAR